MLSADVGCEEHNIAWYWLGSDLRLMLPRETIISIVLSCGDNYFISTSEKVEVFCRINLVGVCCLATSQST